jgi:hypothetical protein
MPAPLSLTDEQMDAVLRAAEPIDPASRSAFLEELAADLARYPTGEIGPGIIYRTIREVQRKFFVPLRTQDAVGKRLT